MTPTSPFLVFVSRTFHSLLDTMPQVSRSTLRRHFVANNILKHGAFATRPCHYCTVHDLFCVVSSLQDSCESCFRFHRSCDLALPLKEIDRLHEKEESLEREIFQLREKTLHLEKIKCSVRKELRKLGDRESQNIADLEMGELAESVGASC
jgi:hypothetical protein